MPDAGGGHLAPGPGRGSAPAPGPAPDHEAADHEAAEPVPRALCDVLALTDAPEASGALWRLAEPGRQLDANVVHLPSGQRVDTHAEPDLDVLLLVVAGHGTLGTADGDERLAEGVLMWLPHGSRRRITAGPAGLSYLTVHRRRPGMQIRSRRETGGQAEDGAGSTGDPAPATTP